MVIPAAQLEALNLSLDVAIAEAVTAYAGRREQQLVGRLEQLGFLAPRVTPAIGGALSVRDLPGTGCVLSVELRRSPAA